MKIDNLSPGDLYGDAKLTMKQAIDQTQADLSAAPPAYEKPHRTAGSVILGAIKALTLILAILCLIILPQLELPSAGIGIAAALILVRVIIQVAQKLCKMKQ